MRRLRRTLLNAATALSLLICVATVVLWLRSRTIVTLIRSHVGVERYAQLISQRGRVGLQYRRTQYPYEPRRLAIHEWPFLADEDGETFAWWAFDAGTASFNYEVPHTVYYVWFPHWALAAVAMLLPGWRSVRRRRRRRLCWTTLCPDCGYDCRATPQRCPECGRETTPAAGAPL